MDIAVKQWTQAISAVGVHGWRAMEKTGQCVNVIMMVFFRALGWLYPKLANRLALGWFQIIAVFQAWRIVSLDEKNKILIQRIETILAENEAINRKNNELTNENEALKKKIPLLTIELDATKALLQPVKDQLQSVIAQNEALRKARPIPTLDSVLDPEQLDWVKNVIRGNV